MDWRSTQSRLGVAVDGVARPRTWAALFDRMALRPLGVRGRELAVGAVAHLGAYDIDTPLRIAHFLAQTCHETGHYHYLREVWGPTPTQRRYEGRRDLGNTQPGDGRLFLGRGLIQLTGRDNYRRTGQRIGIDLEANPVLAERPDLAVLIAADWWHAHGCNRWADADDAPRLSRLINRGTPHATKPANGEAERLVMTTRAKALLLP